MEEERKDDVYRAALAGLLHDVGRAKEEDPHIMRAVELADRLVAGGATVRKMEDMPLQSIFCSLETRNANGDPQEKPPLQYWPLKPLALERGSLFPRPLQPEENVGEEYHALWKEFEGKLNALEQTQSSGNDASVYLENVLLLMQRYTWCIPSAYGHALPDVSLYDHSRMTAALAACLVGKSDVVIEEMLRAPEQSKEPAALLVGGDISGVQKFLYSIASEGAAKSLRGRSVYLQLLTEAVAHYLLDQLGLPLTNLLYAGGGNFYLIAPVTAWGVLPKLQASVSEKLLIAHDANLRLALAWTPVQACEFKIGTFADVWERLHEPLLRRAKEQPLAELSADDIIGDIGVGHGEGGEITTCPVCGREEIMLRDSGVCSLCDSFAELGRQASRATHLVMRLGTPLSARRIASWHQGLEQFGVNVWLVNADASPEQGQYLCGGPRDADYVRLYPLPGTEPARYATTLEAEIQARFPGAMARLFRPFAQLVPYDETGDIKTFDQLAKDSAGISRWGVLRMDVDNLGELFRKGFKQQVDGKIEDHLTLSRVAALSFSLRLFFEGYLPILGKPWEDKLYLQYAGGDDLFVVGAWDVLPGFALVVRKNFGEYVCNNPCITLSGGISLHSQKFPLYRAAEEAGAAESQAKGKRYREGQDKSMTESKNALCFLDVALAWDEFEQVNEQAEKFYKWVKDEKVSKSLLQNLLRLYNEWLTERDGAVKRGQLVRDKFFYGPWQWHAVYQLNRTDCKDKTIRDEIRSWPEQMFRNQALLIRLGVAARWAELLTRKQSEPGGRK